MNSLPVDNTTPEIEVVDLKKTYKFDLLKAPAKSLDGLSLKFYPEICSGLMGHNGAGKTTTIRIILGLIFADQGVVLFRGKPMKTSDRKVMGYMPETNQLAKNLTVIEALKAQSNLFGKRFGRQHLSDALEKVGLAKSSKKLTKELSKGMARRLSWAMATIHDPEVLILDEPFSGMDPLGRLEMSQWIHSQKKNKRTIILCTHETEGIAQNCDVVHIVQKGKLVYSSNDTQDTASQAFLKFQGYSLQVSGTPLAFDRSLPPPDDCEQFAKHHQYFFRNREAAESWLKAYLDAGSLIEYYGKASVGTDPQFLDLFRGGN